MNDEGGRRAYAQNVRLCFLYRQYTNFFYILICILINIRDVPDTTLPDTAFNRIVVYRIYRIPDSSKFKHNSQRMKWEYYCQCSLQLKFKQNMCVFSLIYIKLEQVWQSTNECAARQTSSRSSVVQKSSRSSVFTPVSPISKTEILSGKYPVTFNRIAEFYRIPVFGSGTSLINIHPLFFIYRKQAKYRRNTGVSRQDLIGCRSGRFFAMSGHSHGNLNTKIILN